MLAPPTSEELSNVLKDMVAVCSRTRNVAMRLRDAMCDLKGIGSRDKGLSMLQFATIYCRLAGMSKRDLMIYCSECVRRTFAPPLPEEPEEPRINQLLKGKSVGPN